MICRSNKLTALPELPANIKSLSCISNKLITLPPLPASLTELYCDGNKLKSLSDLPSSLTRLSCRDNSFSKPTYIKLVNFYKYQKDHSKINLKIIIKNLTWAQSRLDAINADLNTYDVANVGSKTLEATGNIIKVHLGQGGTKRRKRQRKKTIRKSKKK